jgi:hypothetical protein
MTAIAPVTPRYAADRSIQSTMTYAQISDARRNRTMRRLEKSREFPIPS